MQLERNADLRPLTTFGVPARTKWLGRFTSVEELRALLQAPEVNGQPRLVLGGGSNMLFTRDWPGVVLMNEIPGIHMFREDAHHAWVTAGAGVVWHALVRHCVDQDWGGLENLSLIPGKVGAAPMQNIGAYGVEIKDHFDHLEALRIEDGEVVTFDREACAFGYRESFFKRAGRDRYIILSVTFRLNKAPHTLNTSYGNIQQELEQRGIASPTLRDVSDAVIAIRRSKLPDPAVTGNAGSFFKNPVVPQALAERLKETHPGLASYPAGPGEVKLAAGWLIEQAGWKGYHGNGHGVHDKQALVLVNRGGATGQAIFDLSQRILDSVRERFGVELEREVNII
ncbi:MAG: UDP-N-acetylmuramate dehydrogenase [Flavobacteriales bacterium]|nr:UDP-N-acetylmuramate dehydrogenase [Flavobacteriales bacterium]